MNLTIIVQWLEMEFLGYLSEWDGSIKGRTGFTDAERKRMRLSDETLEGLRVTGIVIITVEIHKIYFTS